MLRLLTLALLAALTVAEVAAILSLVDIVGPGAALLVLVLDVVVGLWVIRWGARSLPPARAWRIGAGVFIALPGLVLDLVGLALLVPGVQRWISGHLLRGTEAALRARGVSVVTVTDASGTRRTTVVPGDVIPGEVIDQEPGSGTEGARQGGAGSAGAAPDSSQRGSAEDRGGQRPQPGPDVVRGEILGPED
jgi:UPF0716 family protein affecting phage T7 exclusion